MCNFSFFHVLLDASYDAAAADADSDTTSNSLDGMIYESFT